jgi:molybdopterin-guanine dinucleotide biosynthesis protein
MTAVVESSDVQLKRVYQIAQEYRAQGYRVVVGPSQHELPPFLRGFDPDVIALSDADNVVVEVKRRTAVAASRTLSRMAAVIEKNQGWRLELVLIESDHYDSELMPSSATVDHIRNLAARAREAADSELGVVLAWAAVEHAIVFAAQRSGLALPSLSATAGMKTLLAYGLLTDSAYAELRAAEKVRSDIVHRGESDADLRKWVNRIVPIAEQLAA